MLVLFFNQSSAGLISKCRPSSYLFIRSVYTVNRNQFNDKSRKNKMKHLSEHYMAKLQQKYENRLERRLKPQGVRLSKGTAPSLLGEINEGLRCVLTKRQRILDKIFLENITEILACNFIGDFLREMDVLITRVELTRDFNVCHIYFHCKESLAEKVITELNRIKGELHFLLTQKYIMGKIPTLEYIYDNNHEKTNQIEEALAKADMGPDVERPDPDEYIPPVPQDKPGDLPPPKAPHIWSLTTFNQDFADRGAPNPYEMTSSAPYPKFEAPSDMRQDMFGLDYKHWVTKLLFHLSKTRSVDRPFNPRVGPLPPVDWTTVKPMPRQEPDPNDPALQFKERVQLMRSFIIEHRKKRQLLAREAKKQKDMLRNKISDDLDEVRARTGYIDYYEDEGDSWQQNDHDLSPPDEDNFENYDFDDSMETSSSLKDVNMSENKYNDNEYS